MATTPLQRDQTDESLRTERVKADHELEKRVDKSEAVSDAVLAQAQNKADEVLKVARSKADTQTSGANPSALEGERLEQDRALAEERGTAADQLSRERIERRRAMAELLRFERDETDKDLKLERTSADTALGTRDAFLGMATHDLRNLLNGIALTTNMLLKEAPAGEAGTQVIKRAQLIERSAARMNRLLGDLLDVVSIEAGQLSVTPAENSVTQVLEEALETAELAATNKGIALTASLPEGPLTAQFDYGRILQVVVNLLSNAIKFTSAGGRVELRGEARVGHVRISVTDSGCGIPAKELEAIFERFHQVEPLDRGGHGLGLHISRSIVEAHHGKIWAESGDRGSVFRLTLPV